MRDTMIFLFLALICTSASAHHSRAIFDQDQEILIEGVVGSYDWKNPHVYIYVDAEDDTGQLTQWQLETPATSVMARSGWTRCTHDLYGNQSHHRCE